jgi:hypothetical protein
MERLDEIRERLNKATPNNWCHMPNIKKGRSIFSNPDTRLKIGEAYSYDDAVFICYAPEDIKYLLEQINALQEENERLKKSLDNWKYEAQCEHDHVVGFMRDNATLTKALEMACEESECLWSGGITPDTLAAAYIEQARSTINSKEGHGE